MSESWTTLIDFWLVCAYESKGINSVLTQINIIKIDCHFYI